MRPVKRVFILTKILYKMRVCYFQGGPMIPRTIVQNTSRCLLKMSQKSPLVRTKTTFEVIKPISQSNVHAFAALTGIFWSTYSLTY